MKSLLVTLSILLVSSSPAFSQAEAEKAGSQKGASQQKPAEKKAEEATKIGEKKPAKEAKKTGDGKKKGKRLLPRIPKGKLPKRTRTPPDPKKDQLSRGSVYLSIAEVEDPSRGKAGPAKVSVVQPYAAEYFRRAGFRVVKNVGNADFRIEGKVVATFVSPIIFRKRTIGWKYIADASVTVTNRDGQLVSEHQIPQQEWDGGQDEPTASIDIRRLIAKNVHDTLFVKCAAFQTPKVGELLAALKVDPLEAEDPRSGNELVDLMADLGVTAVPFLLEALTDNTTVLAETDFPGLKKLDDLKVYHMADKALEEIFQKVSRLPLKATADERFIVTLGWENEWRRFCPAFRESEEFQKKLAQARLVIRRQQRAKKKANPATTKTPAPDKPAPKANAGK
ncbi:MAG: hypothetical protein AAF517_16005 [Planctomycetota bacterium]